MDRFLMELVAEHFLMDQFPTQQVVEHLLAEKIVDRFLMQEVVDYLLVEKKDAFAEEQTQEKRGFLKKKKVD